MFYWSFTSLVHFWPPPIFNPGYAYGNERERVCVCVIPAKAPTAIAPTFTATPSIHQTGDGCVEFEVRLTSCPAPTVTWYKGTTAISDGGRYRAVTHTDGVNYVLTLTIIGVTKDDGGAYKVTAKTAVGESNANINLNLEGSSLLRVV